MPGKLLLLTLAVISCINSDGQPPKTVKTPGPASGDWTVILEKGSFDGLISRNGDIFGYTSNTFGKTPEIFRIRNNSAELVLGGQDINAKGDYFKTYLDTKSAIYILYHIKNETELIGKWNGDRMEPFGETPGRSMHLWNLFIDPLDQVIGECREKMKKEFGPLVLIKKGAWTSSGLQNVKGFSEGQAIKEFKQDPAGNLYACTASAIVMWNGTGWSEIPSPGMSGAIGNLLFNEEGVLHVVMKPEEGRKAGKIYRFSKGSWAELKLDPGFFDPLDPGSIRFELAGKDQFFAQVQLKKPNASNNDYPVYWWRNNTWVNILEQRSHVEAGNSSFWVYAFGKNLYMNNYKKKLVLKWDPGSTMAVPSTAVPSTALVSKTKEPGKQKVATAKPEVNNVPATKPVETQIQKVGDYYIFRANGKYGVQEGYLRTINHLEATYDTITGLQIKDGNKMKALFMVIDKYGLQVFDPVTKKLFRSAAKIVEYWYYEDGLWLKTDAGRWNRYPEPINSTSGLVNLQFINNSFIAFPSLDRVVVSAWKNYQSGSVSEYSIEPGADIVDFDYTQKGRFTYKIKNKYGYADWENLVFLPHVFDDMKMWRMGSTVYLQFRYEGQFYQATTDNLQRKSSQTYANIKAFQYSATCGRSDCKNGVIGYRTHTSGGGVEKKTYRKLTMNGWIEITETSVTPVTKTKETVRCNDPAHDYKSYIFLPAEKGYEIHRIK